MEVVLYIAATIALLALAWFLISAAKSFEKITKVFQNSEVVLLDVKNDIDQISADVTSVRNSMIPVIVNIAEITQRVSEMTDGLAPRVEAVYGMVDDTLDVAHGLLEDVERLKGEVVDTIETPLRLVRSTSNGVVSGVIKGVGLISDIIKRFKKS